MRGLLPSIFIYLVTIMLSSRTAKNLSKEFEERQAECFGNKNRFTAEEQAFYDLTGNGYHDYLMNSFTVDEQLVDTGMPYHNPKPEKEAVDLRKRPECGD